jgi:hypothetical protein
MLIDFVDVVVHVFNQEARSFYDLDALWGDAKKVEWNPDGQPAGNNSNSGAPSPTTQDR